MTAMSSSGTSGATEDHSILTISLGATIADREASVSANISMRSSIGSVLVSMSPSV